MLQNVQINNNKYPEGGGLA